MKTIVLRYAAHIHRRSCVPEMTDNDYLTHSTEDDVDVNVADADGNATKIDLIGLVTKNVDLTISVYTDRRSWSQGSQAEVSRIRLKLLTVEVSRV